MQKTKSGFTIVELLIVIVVIGVLAAITVVAYNGIQNRGYEASVRSDAASNVKKMMLFQVDNSRFPGTLSELESAGLRFTKSAYAIFPQATVNVGFCLNGTYTDFALLVMAKSGQRYVISSTGSVSGYSGAATWNSTAATLAPVCTEMGMTNALTHGYSSSDTTTGPWRAWANG